jgi:hypothetical protein
VEELRKTHFGEQKGNIPREGCVRFVWVFLKQLPQRIPEKFEVLRKISLLAFADDLTAVKEPLITTREASILDSGTITETDFAWRSLFVKWQNVNDSGRCWCEV